MFVSCMAILHLLLCQVTRGQQSATKAHLKIEFISYVNPNRVEVNGFHCDQRKGALCDPYVELYVYELLESGEKSLIQKKIESHTWLNTNNLTFGENFGPNILNPIILDLPSWNYVNGYSLHISIKDKDHRFHDLIGAWTLPYKSLASTRFAFSGSNRTRLEMQITGYCGSNNYGTNCTTLCLSHQPSYKCDEATGRQICNPGYSGGLCSIWQGECEDYSCSGHGTCIAGSELLTCNCHRGYTGQFCELAIGVCEEAGKLCMNGTCIDDARLENGYRCECNQGYAGVLCDDNTDDCRSSLCQNNGTCLIEADSANCECPEMFDGGFCEHRCSENESLTRMVAAKLCLLSQGSSENCKNLIQLHPKVLLNQTCFLLKNFNCGAQKLIAVQDFPNGTDVMGNSCHWTSDNVICETEKPNYTPAIEKPVTYCMPPVSVSVRVPPVSVSVRVPSVTDAPQLKELVKRYWYLIPTALATVVMVILVAYGSWKRKLCSIKKGTKKKSKGPVYEEIDEQSMTLTAVKVIAAKQNGNGAHNGLCADLQPYEHMSKDHPNVTKCHHTPMGVPPLPPWLNSDQPASQCETPGDPLHPRASPKLNQEPTHPLLQPVARLAPNFNKVGSDRPEIVRFNQLRGNINGAKATPGDTPSSEDFGQSSHYCSTYQSEYLLERDATQTNLKCAKSSPDRKRSKKNPLYSMVQLTQVAVHTVIAKHP